jgi:serine/threonine protein kinase
MPLSDWPRSAAGYETICELGKSAHGSTWKASCTTNGRVVSIKRLNFDAQANLSFELFDAIRKEVSLSMTFSHKCIQTVHAAFMNDAELWVVVDYMDKVSVRLLTRVIAAAFRRYHCCFSALSLLLFCSRCAGLTCRRHRAAQALQPSRRRAACVPRGLSAAERHVSLALPVFNPDNAAALN